MKKKLVAIAAAAVAILPFTGSPAQASVSGAIAFECVAQLPEFPSPQANGSCGTPSAAVGTVSGLSASGQAYTLVAAGVNNFGASFEYQEACVANEPPVLGTANGTATVTGLTGVKNGAPVTASAELQFSWRRVGLTAAITISSGEIQFSDGDTATPLVAASANAAAGFAPVLTLANTCPVGGPLQAAVAGTAAFGG